MFLKHLKRIVYTGFDQNLPTIEKRKVLWFNFVSYFILCVVAFYCFKNYLLGQPEFATAEAFFLVFIVFSIHSHAKKRYQIARLTICLALLFFLFLLNVYLSPSFPGRIYIYYNLAVIILSVFLIDNSRITLFIWFCTIALCLAPQYLFSKEHYHYKTHIHTVILFSFTYFAMNFYKGITLRYQKQLEEKNEENELLLGEVHHRVKNNLQLITSMLRLRERQLTSDKAKKLIGESREQIKAIATAHESLYKKNMGDLLDMNEYVKQLVADTREALGDTAITWKSHIDIGRLFLNADTAVPIGLILNELITNSLKYAKPIRQEVLRIEVKVSEIDGLVQLTYSDNGTPAPEMADALEAGSKRGFGMKLIRSLCRQLGADVNVSTENGLVYDFIFNTQQTVEA
ncbi:hypothetical protein FUAX_38380 (plasmid) [Fulvitalea axinellae]|uniref:histidine kinase n=2 Tax=Fulvitalea axinellae TaxID=1182444 RepID=A0AAU9CGV7_9BACT|nr:hypothetical protein FUAX_38380 [Fulvitalea axinellae]